MIKKRMRITTEARMSAMTEFLFSKADGKNVKDETSIEFV